MHTFVDIGKVKVLIDVDELVGVRLLAHVDVIGGHVGRLSGGVDCGRAGGCVAIGCRWCRSTTAAGA